MAGNKINTKTKGKDDKGKANKNVSNTNEDAEDLDFALLRKPIPTSITGFAQARKIFDLATEELKGLLSNECDLLYECKVCRNIFRSLVNFISHKRVYCKEKFNASVHSHFIKTTSAVNEILKIKCMEEGYQESLKENRESENKETDDVDERIPLTKDLTTIIEKLTKTRGQNESNSEEMQVVLQKIPNSSVAVFQNINLSEGKQKDSMQAQVKELDNILSQDKAVLQIDGKFKIQNSTGSAKVQTDSDNVIQISDDDDNDDSNILRCKICDLQFSTQKTLKFHIKYKHLESRLVYPCPDCFEIFSTSWSVYRHLFKVHRKTAAQIRRLRESIQAKAFRMNNPPASYEKRKNNMKPVAPQKISEEERLDQENQAWMDNMEGDGELPRCGGCGRTFERRAALAAHTHTCQPRSRALARRPQENKKIEIQIRKDYNKGPTTNLTLPPKNTDANDNKLNSEDINTAKSQNESNKIPENEGMDLEEATMDVCENDQIPNDVLESPEKFTDNDTYKPTIKLPFAQQAEKNNLLALKQKIQPDIELDKLLCKRCDIKCNHLQGLYDHMARHYKWMRYACKLCNYKHYDFEKLPEHVKIVHKLKGDTDFYFSTVKAIDGVEALELSEFTDEVNDINETSPDSRRPSRCSSDSSRLSDDSSSSSTRIAEGGSRKRKMYQNKSSSKRKKEIFVNDDVEDQKDDLLTDKIMTTIQGENEPSSTIKAFEENSSDIDDIDEKAKKQNTGDNSSVASRRPVRKRTKPKNEDFEYDLSNLLKMEAQGYRDSQSVASTKPNQNKKRGQQENPCNYDNVNKDYCGALASLSKKAVENATAQMRTTNFVIYSIQKDQRSSNIFIKPMLPKGISRGEKNSPKKDIIEDIKDSTSPNKATKFTESTLSPNKDSKIDKNPLDELTTNIEKDDSKKKTSEDSSSSSKEQKNTENSVCETIKTNLNIPAVVPIKFRRQSLEVIKNPLINKNITDFTKAGMKTKILVIKPINRKNDGTQPLNTPLKFQTIKLKEPNKGPSSSDDKPSDQIVVVKVPKVDCTIVRPVSDTCTTSNEKTSTINASSNSNNNSIKSKDENIEKTCVEDLLETTKIISNDVKHDELDNQYAEKETEVTSADNERDKNLTESTNEKLNNVETSS